MRGLGLVVIGRNEGARLSQVLEAATRDGDPCVYVDSGSSDGSLERARACGVRAEGLDRSSPFTAARGRNLGVSLLLEEAPETTVVMFVDGDCVLIDGWLEVGLAYLREHADVGVVAGLLQEEDPTRNVYHRLASMEWRLTPGEVASTGGIAMMQLAAFQAGGGFDPALAAGEELDLARRIRAAGYRVVLLAAPMAVHDIDMNAFGEWWRRTVRTGTARAEGAWRVGLREPKRAREVLSICFWGGGLPAAAGLFALPTLGLSVGLLTGYPLVWRRIRARRVKLGDSERDAALYATATLVGKFPNALGVGRFARRLASRR